MQLTDAEKAAVEKIAREINVPPAALLAIVEVESNGVTGEMINGRFEPIIRYEGHYFDKLCRPSVRAAARAAGVSSPKAGGVKNPKTQAGRWALLRKVAGFDASAAYQSCSYGVGQVMGAHWSKLGYPTVDNLVKEARSGFAGQVDLMARHIVAFGLDDELRALDWSGFARQYNGSNYRANQYDTKMAAAYKRWGGSGAVSSARNGNLRVGSKGAGVRDLQNMLILAGYNVVPDGDFGPSTKTAVMQFQASRGLSVDGVVGPRTQEALAQLRTTAPRQDTGIAKVLTIPEVQKGGVVALATPGVLTWGKTQVQNVIDQLSPYSALSGITDKLTDIVGIITLVAIVIGGGYAAYGWWRSRQSFTGTRSDDPIAIAPLVALPGD